MFFRVHRQLLGQSPEPSSTSSPYHNQQQHQHDGCSSARSDFDSSGGTHNNSIDSMEATAAAPTKVAATASRRLLDASGARTTGGPMNSFNSSYVSDKSVPRLTHDTYVLMKLFSYIFQHRQGTGYRRCRALYDCNADNDDELEFKEGEVLVVLNERTDDENWMEGEIEGDPTRRGMFPVSFVHMLPD